MFKAVPLDHVPAGLSNKVSLKAFAVELKNNCPSVLCENTDGAVNSSVLARRGDSPPPIAKAAGEDPVPAN